MMFATIRQIGFAVIALAILTGAIYGTSARTANVPKPTPPAAASLPIGIMNLMQSARDLPEQQYEAF
jgi:hypothetical protein